jgi:hypothetical protein
MGVVEWQEGAWHAGCRAGCECAVNAALFVGEWVALRSERLSASDSARRPQCAVARRRRWGGCSLS